jgi:hypothetical protein
MDALPTAMRPVQAAGHGDALTQVKPVRLAGHGDAVHQNASLQRRAQCTNPGMGMP